MTSEKSTLLISDKSFGKINTKDLDTNKNGKRRRGKGKSVGKSKMKNTNKKYK